MANEAEKTITAVKALAEYFNSDPTTKKPLREFTAELKFLSDEEKAELADLAAKAMGYAGITPKA